MLRLYEILAEKFNCANSNLSGLATFNLDEYIGDNDTAVSPEHPLSYRRYMRENFFSLLDESLGFKEENMHFPDALNPEKYDLEIEAAGGLDFQILGIGFNGHIAFNEPMRADEISNEDFSQLPSRVIDLDTLTIQTNARLTADNDLDSVPVKAVTMGMKSILNAKEIMLLACFKEQTEPLRRIKTGEVTTELPASFLLEHSSAEIIFTRDSIDENLN